MRWVMSKWLKHPVRRSQVVSPFGTGNISTTVSGRSVIVSGTENFFKRDQDYVVDDDHLRIADFKIHDWRLEKELNVTHFRTPPTWKNKKNESNNKLRVPVLNFPLYFKCNNYSCNGLYKVKPHDVDAVECKQCNSRRANGFRTSVAQVRFITICKAGHIQDFPWAEWVHKRPLSEIDPRCLDSLKMTTGLSAKLSGIRVECSRCNIHRILSSGIFQHAEQEEPSSWLSDNLYEGDRRYSCPGCMSWLGEKKVACNEAPIVALRGQGNVYFPMTRSSIFIPSSEDSAITDIQEMLSEDRQFFLVQNLILQGKPEGEWDENYLSNTADMFMDQNPSFDKEDVIKAFKLIIDDKEIENTNEIRLAENSLARDIEYRFFEFCALKKEIDTAQLSIEKVDKEDFLSKNTNEDFKNLISKINQISLIKSLTETTALTGFSRVYPFSNSNNIQSTFDPDTPADKDWYLARQSKGEGIFIELDEESLINWENKDEVIQRAKILEDKFANNPFLIDKIHQTKPRFILIHTLAHILMKELVFHCGYGSASLRERLYVSEADDTKMSAFMIFTAGDTAGSMGGLVKEGKPHKFMNTLRSAVLRSRWCSSDPVCASVSNPSGGNNFSCLSCSFVSETSCETGNTALDRTFVGAIADNDFEKVSFFDL